MDNEQTGNGDNMSTHKITVTGDEAFCNCGRSAKDPAASCICGWSAKYLSAPNIKQAREEHDREVEREQGEWELAERELGRQELEQVERDLGQQTGNEDNMNMIVRAIKQAELDKDSAGAFQMQIALASIVAQGANGLFNLRYMIEHGGLPEGYGADLIRESVQRVKGEADALMVKLGGGKG